MKKLLALLAVLALGTQVSFAAEGQTGSKQMIRQSKGILGGWLCNHEVHGNDPATTRVEGNERVCEVDKSHRQAK